MFDTLQDIEEFSLLGRMAEHASHRCASEKRFAKRVIVEKTKNTVAVEIGSGQKKKSSSKKEETMTKKTKTN